jgi:dihydroflavonol-4-reductase
MGAVLVTGGNGYIGGHCVLELLKAGYTVRTTVRSPEKAEAFRAMIHSAGIPDPSIVTVCYADLSSDAGWAEAITGCEFVLHVASPFPSDSVPEEAIIGPARDGALRVLTFAKQLNVKRVVLTSSFAAIGYQVDLGPTFDESFWTDPASKAAGMSGYIKSKAIAEKAAWDFVRDNGGPELVTICPTGVLGPALSANLSNSIQIVKALIDGSMPGIPDIGFAIADVRDVAMLHVKALTAPVAGQRFIVSSAENWTLVQIAEVLREGLGDRAGKVPKKQLWSGLVKFLGVFSGKMSKLAGNLGVVRKLSNAKATAAFEWTPIDTRKSILDTAESLFALGVCK